jgi:hypothetical protein
MLDTTYPTQSRVRPPGCKTATQLDARGNSRHGVLVRLLDSARIGSLGSVRLVPAVCLWVPHAVMSTRMALITSVLVVITYLFDDDIGIPTWISLTNTFVAIVLVWSVTWMAAQSA